MIQGIKKGIFTLVIGCLCLNSVNAARSCSVSEKAELNKILPNIKASYEEKEEKFQIDENGYVDGEKFGHGAVSEDGNKASPEIVDEVISNYFDITITNITDQFYVEISNDLNDEIKRLNYSDAKDGVLTYSWNKVYKITNFTITIYTSDKTSCAGTLQKTLKIKTPRLNEYYDLNICKDIPEFNLCQKFVTFNYMNYEDFEKKVNAYKENKNPKEETTTIEEKNTWGKIQEFISNNKYYFIGGGILILIGGGVVAFVTIKKRRSIGL